MRELRALLAREWRDLRAPMLVLAAVPLLMTALECAFPTIAPVPLLEARIVQPALAAIFLVVVGSASFSGQADPALDGLMLAPVEPVKVWLAKLANLALLGVLLTIWSIELELLGARWRDPVLPGMFLDELTRAWPSFLVALTVGCGAVWLASALRSSFQATMIALVCTGICVWLARGVAFDEEFWMGMGYFPPESAFTAYGVCAFLACAAVLFLGASRLSFSPWRQNASRQRWRVIRGLVPPALLIGTTAVIAEERMGGWEFDLLDPRVRIWTVEPDPRGGKVAITYGIGQPLESYRVRFVDLDTGEVSEQPDLPLSSHLFGTRPDGKWLVMGRDAWYGQSYIYFLDPETLAIDDVQPYVDGKTWEALHGRRPRLGDWGKVESKGGWGDGLVRIWWGDREYEIPAPEGHFARCRCAGEPGVVLCGSASEGLARVDLRTGERHALIASEEEPISWWLSGEGRFVIVNLRGGARTVHRVDDGVIVGGPWSNCSIWWANAQEEDRYVELHGWDGRQQILDLVEGRTVELGEFLHTRPLVLRDGRLLLTLKKHVDLLDRDGRLLRTIWPPPE